MDRNLTLKVIEERTATWDSIGVSEKKKICDCAEEVLAYCESKDISFDKSAGITFVTHITSLYDRIQKNSFIEIEEELFSQVDENLFDMANEIYLIIKKHFNGEIDKGEIFLIATHVGSMKERIARGICD